jgi:NADH-quinone oxidoreductase subunit J
MTFVYYLAAAVSVLAAFKVITGSNPIHALLYMVVSLLSLALIFFVLGAPFAAALEVIVYAGAIIVLFIFVVMMLNLGSRVSEEERQWIRPRAWIGPAILCGILLLELLIVLVAGDWGAASTAPAAVAPKQVGIALFGPYVLGVELAAMLLLAGLVGAYHLGRRLESDEEGGS